MFPWKDNLSIYIFFIHEFQYPVNLNIIHEERRIESRGNMMVIGQYVSILLLEVSACMECGGGGRGMV